MMHSFWMGEDVVNFMKQSIPARERMFQIAMKKDNFFSNKYVLMGVGAALVILFILSSNIFVETVLFTLFGIWYLGNYAYSVYRKDQPKEKTVTKRKKLIFWMIAFGSIILYGYTLKLILSSTP
jgi:hypothetical protein